MKLSASGLNFIKAFEDCRLKAYRDYGGVWTVGWGHTGPEVHEGLKLTQGAADALLDADVAIFERDVNALVKVSLTQNQFDALVSFAFNVGSDIDDDTKAEGLGDSTLLRLLNAGNYTGASLEFPKWSRAGGKIVRGLVRRRQAEMAIFLTRDSDLEVPK